MPTWGPTFPPKASRSHVSVTSSFFRGLRGLYSFVAAGASPTGSPCISSAGGGGALEARGITRLHRGGCEWVLMPALVSVGWPLPVLARLPHRPATAVAVWKGKTVTLWGGRIAGATAAAALPTPTFEPQQVPICNQRICCWCNENIPNLTEAVPWPLPRQPRSYTRKSSAHCCLHQPCKSAERHTRSYL